MLEKQFLSLNYQIKNYIEQYESTVKIIYTGIRKFLISRLALMIYRYFKMKLIKKKIIWPKLLLFKDSILNFNTFTRAH